MFIGDGACYRSVFILFVKKKNKANPQQLSGPMSLKYNNDLLGRCLRPGYALILHGH